MGFVDITTSIAEDFSSAAKEPFAKNPVAERIRSSWPASLKPLLPTDIGARYLFDASPGLGQWAHAPWLAVLHPEVTKSAQLGFYPVYLYEPGFETVCLVLGQGAQRLRESVGKAASLVELASRAEALRLHGGAWAAAGFVQDRFLTMKHVSSAASGTFGTDPWSVSVAFGKRYQLQAMPSDMEMAADLMRMLDLYEKMAKHPKLAFARTDDELASLKVDGELPSGSVDGAKRVIQHKRIEARNRDRKLIAAVKAKLGSRCQACNLAFHTAYGPAMTGYIEAHHTVPLSTLPDEGALLTPTVDHFMVLCSNCHRAIHRAGCPDLATFKAALCSPLPHPIGA